jgi:tRNA pseudouridine55 synthase
MLSGILNVDKPRGMTSHDVVDAVRRLVQIRAVGHTGTLDPAASGVLLLCLGGATKFAQFFADLGKTYWTVLRLGVRTDTQDATGTVLQQSEVPPLSHAYLRCVLTQFTGPLRQIPPMYSAVKHRGQRLYRLARQGQTVIRQARDIFIERLELLDIRGPWLTLSVTCSKGTYIRTLGEDIGLALGCGAHVACLQRCRVGPFALHRAYTLDFLQQRARENVLAPLLMPIAQALEFLPALRLTPQQYEALQRGRERALPTILSAMQCLLLHASSYRLCTPQQKTVAVIQRQESAVATWKFHALENLDD